MSKCTNCRKAEAMDTKIDRLLRWFFYRLFPKQITDLVSEKFTQGFSDGYSKGMEHAKKNQEPVKTVNPTDMWPIRKENEPTRVKKYGKSKK